MSPQQVTAASSVTGSPIKRAFTSYVGQQLLLFPALIFVPHSNNLLYNYASLSDICHDMVLVGAFLPRRGNPC